MQGRFYAQDPVAHGDCFCACILNKFALKIREAALRADDQQSRSLRGCGIGRRRPVVRKERFTPGTKPR